MIYQTEEWKIIDPRIPEIDEKCLKMAFAEYLESDCRYQIM
jgi:hypothetical protein